MTEGSDPTDRKKQSELEPRPVDALTDSDIENASFEGTDPTDRQKTKTAT